MLEFLKFKSTGEIERGVWVVGAWMWDKDLKLGLVTEIDKIEAYKAIRENRAAGRVVAFVTTVLILILAIFYTLNRKREVKINEQLESSEYYNRRLFELSPIGLVLTDMKGFLIDVNPAYAKIIGRTIKEIKGLSYWDITPNDYEKQEQIQLKKLKETGKYGPYEKEYTHKKGHRVPVRLSGMIIEDHGKKQITTCLLKKNAKKQIATCCYKDIVPTELFPNSSFRGYRTPPQNPL